MTYIKVISPAQAEGRLEKIYQRVQAPGGQVDNVLQVHSLRPHTLEGHMALYKAVLHHSGNHLPGWYLEAVGVTVSRLNDCEYCVAHHVAGLRKLLAAAGMDCTAYLAALGQQEASEPFTTKEQLGLVYARKLTNAPGQIKTADISVLQEAGFPDGEILELNQVAAYFSYANRTVAGLGVNRKGEMLGQSPATGDDESGWTHG